MGSNSSFFFVMLIMIVIWYFLLIRPQQQRTKRHKEMINNLKKGDQVVTQGGVFAKVSSVGANDNEIEVEIASGVKIKVVRSTIQMVIDKTAANTPAKPADAKPAEKAKPAAKAKTTKAKTTKK